MARLIVGSAVIAASLGACAPAAAPPTPTIEYRTRSPAPIFLRPESPIVTDSSPSPSVSPHVEAQSTAPTIVPVPPEPQGAAYAGQCGWGYSANVTRWWPVITQYPWDACTVVYIISRESGGLNVYNFEGSGACGVMQLLPCRYPSDGAANIAYGYYHKYLLAGWSPWAVMP